ncbi:MAG TPA: DUF6279 family lipoprotein [Nitrospira sp.]|nr:DUF6279 family lipoprotein [Nitrospira sp.]
MIGVRLRRALLLAALTVSLAVAGCATTLLYNHADWLIVRQLDGYFDLSRSQKDFLYDRLDTIIRTHRHEALPRYEAVLQQVSARVQQRLTQQDLEWAFAQYDELKTDLFARFATDGADFARLVSARQVSRLRETLQGRLHQEERLLQESPAARLKHRTERILSLAREWLGTMTAQQEDDIRALAMEFPDTVPAWYAYQQRRNERLIALLESKDSRETAARLHDWLVEKEKEADRAFAESMAGLRQHIARLVLTCDRLATPKQRAYFLAKLNDLAKTLRRLQEA